jgi:hypothetical protein
MPNLIFNAADVRRVVEHSIASPKQLPMAYTKDEFPEEPAVVLVHDQGIYLMSNGDPRDLERGDHSFCAYAQGCHPQNDPEWWDTARDLVGGDDFGETLPWARKMAEMLAKGATQIIIGFSEKQLSLSARLPKSPAKKTGKK